MGPSANDKEKSDVAAAGPMARIMDTSSWAIPFVAPNDARFGDAAEMYMKIQPVRAGSTSYCISGRICDPPKHELIPRAHPI
jgi:hypothetical protein